MYIVLGPVLLRSQTDAGGILCEVHQSAPHQRWNEDTHAGVVHVKHFAVFAVVQFYIEAASYWEKHHLASAVGMVSAHVAVLNFVSPEDTFNGEWDVSIPLSKSQTATLVGNLGELYKEAPIGEFESCVTTHLT